MSHSDRRDFLKFIGQSALLLSITPRFTMANASVDQFTQTLVPLKPTIEDTFKTASGFNWYKVISWGDLLNTKNEKFGYNNDFIACHAMNPKEVILWVNHEYVHPLFTSGHIIDENFHRKTIEQATMEMKEVGGSLIHLKRNEKEEWKLVLNSDYNRRLDGFTSIEFSPKQKIKGSEKAIGTLANCAGGVTPWGNILSCEENYQNCYGEIEYDAKNVGVKKNAEWTSGWDIHYNHPTEHYGWVVEVNPKTGEAKKLVSLGRFVHEGATCISTKDGRTVVYMGEDITDGCFFKFVAKDNMNLDEGELFVANIEKGEWISLDYKKNKKLKERFKDQSEVLIRASEAAALVGGSKLDRPEDCEIDFKTGTIYLNCTNNNSKNRPYGSILKFNESGDYDAMKFTSSLFIPGGPISGIACPDNIAIDRNGHLWITTDISEDKIGKSPYEEFGNNALYFVPTSGKNQGKAYRVAQAPMDAELTGPCFSPDGTTLFLSIQHPGARTKSLSKLTSHWPDGGESLPKPSVVALKLPKELL
jgi:secreted PhoX family phosphatase